jgi:hypothetical protein
MKGDEKVNTPEVVEKGKPSGKAGKVRDVPSGDEQLAAKIAEQKAGKAGVKKNATKSE